MLILSIETSSDICSLSLYKNNDFLYYKESNIELKHSITLFNMINEMLKKTKIKINELDYIAVSNGPGSFTGLRIGVAAALGLAYKDNIKIKFINTLKSLNNIDLNHNIKYIIDLIYAQKNRLYINLYDVLNNKYLINDSLIEIDDFIKLYNKYIFDSSSIIISGDGYIKNKNYINKNTNYKQKYLYNQNAKLILYESLKDKSDISMPIINYVQKSSAEYNLLKNNSK